MRRKQIFRLALALVLLLAVAMETHLLGFTPGQNIRAAEHQQGLAPTAYVLHRDDLYLTEHDDVLLLTAHTPGLWVDRWGNSTLTYTVIDKPDQAPALGGGFWRREFARSTLHLFGEVFLEEAVAVRAYCQATPINRHPSVELTAEIFTAENGGRYFWSVTEVETDEIETLPFALDVLDKDGKVLYTCDTSNNWTGDG